MNVGQRYRVVRPWPILVPTTYGPGLFPVTMEDCEIEVVQILSPLGHVAKVKLKWGKEPRHLIFTVISNEIALFCEEVTDEGEQVAPRWDAECRTCDEDRRECGRCAVSQNRPMDEPGWPGWDREREEDRG